MSSSEDEDSIIDDEDSDGLPSLCTFAATGEHPAFQAILICRDCITEENAGLCICQGCAATCHANHDVEYIAMGPAYCDCQQDSCLLRDVSKQEAQRLGINSTGMPRHVSVSVNNEYLQQVFDIPSLDDKLCQRLVDQAIALVKHTRDTHWVDLNSPDVKTCDFEELALSILSRHVKEYQLSVDNNTFHGGAEWWLQVKTVAAEDEAVDLHYDKDEALAESFELGSFPTLSTVTYLTSNASPTIVFPHTYDMDEGQVMEEMLVSHPRKGKHLVFDGRLLHGAPSHPALRPMQDQNDYETLPGVRVTFLVNIWATGRPSGVTRLPSEIRKKVKSAVSKRKKWKQSRPFCDLEFQRKEIECLEMNKEEDLPESLRDRIELPFVSKGATWITKEEGSDLVVITFPPLPTEKDVFRVRFGPGLQAYLDYKPPDEEDDLVRRAQEAPYLEDYV